MAAGVFIDGNPRTLTLVSLNFDNNAAPAAPNLGAYNLDDSPDYGDFHPVIGDSGVGDIMTSVKVDTTGVNWLSYTSGELKFYLRTKFDGPGATIGVDIWGGAVVDGADPTTFYDIGEDAASSSEHYQLRTEISGASIGDLITVNIIDVLDAIAVASPGHFFLSFGPPNFGQSVPNGIYFDFGVENTLEETISISPDIEGSVEISADATNLISIEISSSGEMDVDATLSSTISISGDLTGCPGCDTHADAENTISIDIDSTGSLPFIGGDLNSVISIQLEADNPPGSVEIEGALASLTTISIGLVSSEVRGSVISLLRIFLDAEASENLKGDLVFSIENFIGLSGTGEIIGAGPRTGSLTAPNIRLILTAQDHTTIPSKIPPIKESPFLDSYIDVIVGNNNNGTSTFGDSS